MFGIFRYVLALMVASGHIHYSIFGVPNWLGLYAVFGFFTLSGYLMTRVLHETYGYSVEGFSRYLSNRALRIYPPYWVAMLLTIAFLATVPDAAGNSASLVYLPDGIEAYIRNFVIVGVHYQYTPAFVPPAWSLHVELLCYVIMGLGMSRTRGLAMLWFAGSVAWTLWAFATDAGFGERYSTVLGASLAFSAGALVYHFANLRRPWMWAALVLFLPHAIASNALWSDVHAAGFYVSFAMVPFCVLALSEWQPAPAVARIDQWLGDLSYPIFLMHTQAGLVMRQIWPLHSPFEQFLATLPLLHVIAVLMHLGVVAPLDSARRRIRSRATGGAA